MLAILNKILVLSLIFIFTACASKDTDITKKQKHSLEKKDEKSLESKNDVDSKKVDELDISKFKDSILLKQKLLNCGIVYEPWKDRLDNDLLLQKKLILICNDISFYLKGYIVHTKKEDRYKGFVMDNHVFIPSNWSKKQIYHYIINLKSNSTIALKKQLHNNKQYPVKKIQEKNTGSGILLQTGRTVSFDIKK